MRTYLLLFLLVASQAASTQQRGFKRVELSESKSLETLYKENHALLIGNTSYGDGWPSLSGVKDDIEAVSEALESRGFNVIKAYDLNKFQLDSSITSFISKFGTNREAGLLFYFAGHGHTVQTNYGEKLGYIVPVGAPDPNENPMAFQSNATEMAQIEIYAKRIESKHALFMFDACFSGSIFSATRAIPEVISYKTAQPVRQFISSGTEDEKVSDESIFRKQFVEALTTTNADFNDDGFLTGTELGQFLQSTVINYSKNSQHPQYGKLNNPALNKGDFVFTLRSESDQPATPTGTTEKTTLSASPLGAIELTTEIGGDLYLNGKLLGAVSANSIVPINDLPEGEHEIEVRGTEARTMTAIVARDQVSLLTLESNLDDRMDIPFVEMVFVQGGTFQMGSVAGEDDEQPAHDITLSDFEISAFEITVGQFREFVNETEYKTEAEVEGWAWVFDGQWKKKIGYHWQFDENGEKATDNRPVTYVSWNDCQKFAEWLGAKYGGRFRLPTEAEWEYAAKGGIHRGSWEFSGGEIAPMLGWFETNSDGKAHIVGQQKPNALNLYDMSGNVWEWCTDWYGAKYYERTSTTNPKGVLSSEFKVLRGGSWNNDERSGRVANRHKNRPHERDSFTGFRVVRETY